MRWLRSLIGTSVTDGAPERSFRGLPVSGGMAIGPVHVLREKAGAARNSAGADDEARLLRSALDEAKAQLETLIAAQDRLAGEILEFQLALLEDDDMLAPAFRAIEAGTPCDRAWTDLLDAEIAEYRGGGSETLAARADDMADLKGRVLRAITGGGGAGEAIPEGAIVIASDFTPSAFLSIDWDRAGGAATLGGSPVSHVSILARARGVNFVVGLDAKLEDVRDGETAFLDAASGALTVSPDATTLAAAKAGLVKAGEERRAIDALLPLPAVTDDGEPVRIYVNIDDPLRLGATPVRHCDGVGLTRTEFLFQDGHLPDEEQQLDFYRRLIEWAEGRPVTIRTLDAGGDKPIPGVTIDGETNPFLGVRGLRLSLAKPEIFRVQLRALARAASLGPVNVMFPMVTVPQELAEARRMMLAEVAALLGKGVPCAAPRMGIMVEVPSAAMMADAFDADFYSIGSNDLIQYATACARDNIALASLADPLNPAVLMLISRTVEAARARGVEVSLCGDMASTPRLVGALLDCGLRTLSCAPAQIGPVKLAVRRHSSGTA